MRFLTAKSVIVALAFALLSMTAVLFPSMVLGALEITTKERACVNVTERHTDLVDGLEACANAAIQNPGTAYEFVQREQFLYSPPAVSSASISWTAPTENTDGTPLTDLAGFKIYYGTESRVYGLPLIVVDPAATAYTISGLPPGSYHIAATAFDVEGEESDYSNEVVRSL